MWFVGHAIDFSITLNCIVCLDDYILAKYSLWSFFNDWSCLLKLCFMFHISFGILIALCLFFIHALCSTCLVFNEVICYVQVFQDTSVQSSSASQLLDLVWVSFAYVPKLMFNSRVYLGVLLRNSQKGRL